MIQRRVSTVSAVAALSTLALAQTKGPSSSQTPYVVPVAPGVQTVSILTVGDAPQTDASYHLVGIPDGLGAFSNGAGTFTLLVNHEIPAGQGVVRAHGSKGAFVSRWKIRANGLKVLQGRDLIEHANCVTGTSEFSRFCSADLADGSAFFLGNGRSPLRPELYLNGEETGAEGRAFGHVASGPLEGESFELPALGKKAFENVVARPGFTLRTVVASTDDSTPGQVYVYLGWKQLLGNPVQRAGLTNGRLFGVRVPGVPTEDRVSGIGAATRFELADLGDVAAMSGAELQTASTSAAVTEFLRPEDCAWAPNDPRLFYFVTTDRFGTTTTIARSRLWQLRFDSVLFPEAGGTIRALLDGTEGQQMLDNICVDRHGNLLLQEDIGNQDALGALWFYDVAHDALTKIAQHDPARFTPGAAGFLTRDEESSGIIDASEILGPGWFLLDVQAHYPIAGELVEGGQLLALYNPASH